LPWSVSTVPVVAEDFCGVVPELVVLIAYKLRASALSIHARIKVIGFCACTILAIDLGSVSLLHVAIRLTKGITFGNRITARVAIIFLDTEPFLTSECCGICLVYEARWANQRGTVAL
jgi:hypothetical protein